MLIRSGNTAPIKTISTTVFMPIPNQTRKIGRNTSRGVALNAVTNGSNIAFNVCDRPRMTPSGSATMTDSPRPMLKAVELNLSAGQIMPVENISYSLMPIADGVVKKSCIPFEKVTKKGNASHRRRTRTIKPIPRT